MAVQVFQDHAMEWRYAPLSDGDQTVAALDSFESEELAVQAAGEAYPDDEVFVDIEAIDDIDLPKSPDARIEDDETLANPTEQ